MAAAALPFLAQIAVPLIQKMMSGKGSQTSSSPFSQAQSGPLGQTQQLPTVNPQQQEMLSGLLSQLQGPLSSGIEGLQNILSGAPGAFEAFEKPSMRQFQEEIVPSLTQPFASANAGASSGFQQTLARAGERLSESLAGQRAGLQNQALTQLQGLLGIGTKPQFENVFQQKAPGFGASFSGGFGQSIGQAIPQLIQHLMRSR